MSRLFECAEEYGWELKAWAVLSNHCHFVASSPGHPAMLRRMISKLHTLTARERAENWRWCSAGRFERRASLVFRRLLDGVKTDRQKTLRPHGLRLFLRWASLFGRRRLLEIMRSQGHTAFQKQEMGYAQRIYSDCRT